jgi:hypothetical protein
VICVKVSRATAARACGLVLALVLGAGATGCAPSLPEAGTPSAELYARRCGVCHPPYNPTLLTAKMWEAMVDRMETVMKRQAMELSADEKSAILAYLSRNAGGH